MIQYEKHGVTLDRVDLFMKTRVKKDGQAINEECASMIVRYYDILKFLGLCLTRLINIFLNAPNTL